MLADEGFDWKMSRSCALRAILTALLTMMAAPSGAQATDFISRIISQSNQSRAAHDVAGAFFVAAFDLHGVCARGLSVEEGLTRRRIELRSIGRGEQAVSTQDFARMVAVQARSLLDSRDNATVCAEMRAITRRAPELLAQQPFRP
jgi:hypothetical protein